MQDCAHLVVEIAAIADVAVAAAAVRAWAQREGLDASAAAELATCASELASNAMRHGGGGRLEATGEHDALVIRAGDRGRGDLEAIRDRLAEARTSARDREHGLATVVRWMDAVEVRARTGGGIEIVASRRRARRSRP